MQRSIKAFILRAFVPVAALLVFAIPLFASDAPLTETDPAQICRELGRGINLGNALESPHEGEWGVTLREEDFALVHDAGFSTIRVPIKWSGHAGEKSPYTIDPAFFQRIDWVVAQAEAHHLNVILDLHHFQELFKDPAGQADRFIAIWKQIAEHYQNAPPTVLFELLNEPEWNVSQSDILNGLIPRALAVIRPTNPTRLIVIGPVQWNSISALPQLVLPADDLHLVATVHFYDPMHFTHQGAEWIWKPGENNWLGTKWLGTNEEKKAVEDSLDHAAAWGRDHKRPIFLGEFGSYSKGDMDSRARWTAEVARAAEARGMAWSYWEFRSGFGIYDLKTDQWHEPLLHALIPDSPK